MPAQNITDTIWVLTDDRPGNVNQALGVAESLGLPFKIKRVGYNAFVHLPNILRGASGIGIEKKSFEQLQAPWPKLVISAGRRSAPLLRYIKKQSQGQTRIVQLMRPDAGYKDFDLIAVPYHDKVKMAPNILRTLGSPHKFSADKIKDAAEYWKPKFMHLPRPWLGVMIGGAVKHGKMTVQHAKELIEPIVTAAQSKGGSLLITTSRRTPEDVIEFIESKLKLPHYMHVWGGQQENPYSGFLALSSVLIVTGDSMSMCSEACATGKPVYIFSSDDFTKPKHRRFHNQLYRDGYAKPHAEFLDTVFKWSGKKLEPAMLLAERIHNMLQRRSEENEEKDE